ncbi:hypothetical protein [Metabacillus litoralis]|uniref:hypothetical protein n=1 Tax=Metabacillus litoralis TaxID=152268 RepID=UPI00203C96A9|nr:hypothetical protein [Metabacillus litoralis]MCM3160986.1 hypothetical protein [Metabacillus litoralis]
MALKTNGFTDSSTQRYFVDAGAVYKNVVIDDTGAYVAGDLLGATFGGNEFVVETEIRQIQVDGAKGRTKGLENKEFENPTLTVNLKELTAQNLSLVIAGSKVDTTTNTAYDIITSKGAIELDDYLDNIALVGKLTGTDKPIVIVVENVLSIEGLEMKTADNNEVVIPVSLGGHYDQSHYDNKTAPYKIYFPKESTPA